MESNNNSKEFELSKYSNYNLVNRLTKKLLKNNTLQISSRKNKKYMILNPETQKYVHFGEMGFEDYTKHKDKDRRDQFKARNHKWKFSKIYTPSFLSYFLLW